jgi:hypothetical protein
MPATSAAHLRPLVRDLDAAVGGLPVRAKGPVAAAIARYRDDAAALRFHIDRTGPTPPLVAILGGTGTGKSTLVNRLLGDTVTATSARRTFTVGCVAVVAHPSDVPTGWLAIEHILATETPARGTPDLLTVVSLHTGHSPPATLIDSPDLDGDHPAHHAQADRAFRWATAVVFVVTPEKYQMIELLPYYRLAGRYALPASFVMNKCQEAAVVDDFRAMLATRDWPDAPLFVVPRDDAAYEPPPGATLNDLKAWLGALAVVDGKAGERGLENRVADLTSRVRDHIVAPLREQRRAVDAVVERLTALAAVSPGVDASPLTLHLQRRMQQKSVLYLMGPQRVLDRARQIPSLLARLPRAAWDYAVHGTVTAPPSPTAGANGSTANGTTVPDFHALMADAWAVVRTRIDDAVRASPLLAAHADDPSYTATFLPTERAAAIADEELASLQQWLEARWNADPRDTRVLRQLLNALPGGGRLSHLSEAAPYLLAIVVATHHAFFGPVDLLILGGYGLAAWMTERASNEVAARTRATNRAIEERFEQLAREQVTAVTRWLESRVPAASAIGKVEEAVGRLEK